MYDILLYTCMNLKEQNKQVNKLDKPEDLDKSMDQAHRMNKSH